MEKEILRQEQKKEDTWNLESIYETREKYQEDYEKVVRWMDELSHFQGQVGESSKNLLAVLNLDQQIERQIQKMSNYAYRKYDEDLSNISSQELVGSFDQLYAEYSKKSSFLVPEILKIEDAKMQKFLKEESDLEEYHLLLQRIFRKKKFCLLYKWF